MRLIENLGDEAHQVHTLLFEESEIVLTMRFHPPVEQWAFDCMYKDFEVYGQRLIVGATHIRPLNQPFDFALVDESGEGLDPFRRVDFSSGRISMYLLERADMLLLRNGVEVP